MKTVHPKTLVVNGVEVATKAAVDHAVVFEAAELKEGANAITAKAMGPGAMSMTSGEGGMGKEMQEFVGMMTLANMLKMAGGAITADEKYELNEKLNKIAK